MDQKYLLEIQSSVFALLHKCLPLCERPGLYRDDAQLPELRACLDRCGYELVRRRYLVKERFYQDLTSTEARNQKLWQ
jgi:hypothetical protein